MQKYLPFASRSNECAYLMTDDDRPAIAVEPVYLVRDADAALAAKDRDLADANHALLLANSNADAFRRVAEQRQGEIERYKRAVEWCLERGVWRSEDGRIRSVGRDWTVPTEFADIIKPTTGASNG